MALPEGVVAPEEEPLEGSIPELHVVKDTQGFVKEEKPLEGAIPEVPEEGEWAGKTEVSPEVVSEMDARIDAREQEHDEQEKLNTFKRETTREDVLQRDKTLMGKIRGFLGLRK